MDDRSLNLYSKACELIPGGVNSPVRACKSVDSFPLFIDSALGSHIVDVDGNEYVDFVLSWGPMLLGHADPDVTSAISNAASKGTSFGAPCPAEVDLAVAMINAVPYLEMIRMVNSGTEATMSAIRLARGITGRNKILKFAGCYHGHADSFLVAAGSGIATLSIPGSPGVPDNVIKDTLIVQYNNLNEVIKCFEKYGSDIAAIIVEPVAANMGLVLPLEGFLQQLRKIADEYGSLLIFDEVITGFRLAFECAQGRYGIEPDLATFGKIIGGGLPVGAFGGKREFMQRVAPAGDIYQAGTLSGNPLAMTAGLATLKKLKTYDYAALEEKTATFAHTLNEILASKNVPIQIPTIASMFSIFFSEGPVNNFAQAQKCDQKLYGKFYRHMRSEGIYLAPSGFETGMVSFAHTAEDFNRTLAAAEKVVF